LLNDDLGFLHPKPVNVMITGSDPSMADVAAIGALRGSVGGSLAAAAWRGFDTTTRMLRTEGRLPPRR
jgi:hypothetical protein